MRYKHKPRPPMRDNSCSLSVRMTEEQYQRLCRYLAITRLPVTTYFRKLIKEATIHARMPRQQIAQLEFLADKLCEEYFLLSTQ